MPLIIAIDGPSASGKSTVARMVADNLGCRHVDTGSMYRAFTWKALQEKVDPRDTAAVMALMKKTRYECDFIEDPVGPLRLRNRLDGCDPGQTIRTPEVEAAVSAIAAIPQVRQWLVEKQRSLAEFGDLVMEGRDIGTVVFPLTPYKFYLDADPAERARRRANERDSKPPLPVVGKAMEERDRLDSTRAVAPLKIAEDAMRIDTSNLDAQGVTDLILKQLRSNHFKKGKALS